MDLIKEVEEAIYSINCDIYDQTRSDYIYLTSNSNGFCIIVEFADIQIWNSDDDSDRPYFSEKDEEEGNEENRESIEAHLRKKTMDELAILNKIKL